MKPMSKVISFFSPISNIGTTTTVLSVAAAIVQNSNMNVAVLSFNPFDDGIDFIQKPGPTLDEIKSQIFLLEQKDLESKFSLQQKNLFYLLGNSNQKIIKNFTLDEAKEIILKARSLFDLVIIDGGWNFDNALSIGALVNSDRHFMILNQQPKTLKQYRQLQEQILTPLELEIKFRFILNAHENKLHLNTPEQIKEELNLQTNLITIPKVDKDYIAEIEADTLYDFGELKYQKSIDNLIQKTLNDFVEVELPERKNKKFALLFR